MRRLLKPLVVLLSVAIAGGGCRPTPESSSVQTAGRVPPAPLIVAPPPFDESSRPYALAGPLVPASVTMISAWDVPRNPMTDPTLGSTDGAAVRRGFELFMNTPVEAPRLTASGMSCGNCHLNAGQRERALPLVGAAGMFPEYNRRAGRDFTLEDRIVGCFLRSENATGGSPADDEAHASGLPTSGSPEVLDLAAYIRWLSEGYVPGQNPPWRKQNQIPDDQLIPIGDLDPRVGELLFAEHCINCHGEDGQGVQIADKRAGPLWGSGSWNDGAGVARTYTLAGFIRYAMPYLDPGVLSDADAQYLAAYISSKPRPAYPRKADDYLTEPLPVDAVYYKR